jgi:3-hydroxyisobutyrate dehydrogenase-like beta-hydroxyacid dehydrogenase
MEGKAQAASEQARLPSLKIAQDLMAKAKAQGWGNYDASSQ